MVNIFSSLKFFKQYFEMFWMLTRLNAFIYILIFLFWNLI